MKKQSENTSFNHGAITLSSNKKYLQYEDGTPFFWFADTWWYGGTGRTTLADFEKLVQDRKQKGFTVVQIVVGIPPESDPFSENCKNTGGFPFTKDWRINKKYFDEIDKRIGLLINNDIVPCIVGGWGNQITSIGMEPLKKLWDEILARYSKYPVIFCLCGEANLITPYIPGMPQKAPPKLFTFARELKRKFDALYFKRREIFLIKKNVTLWNELAEYIQEHNKKNRPLTVHIRSDTTAKELFRNPSWLTINTIQSGHDKTSVPFMVQSITKAAEETLPVINMEPWYEGIFGNFGAYYQRFAFWACILSGAKGHTYGAHGIWQMAKNDDAFMRHWGDADWEKSLQFEGAEQLGRAVQFLRQYPWWELKSDFASISPHWNQEQPTLPLAATIEGKALIVYIPDVSLIKSKLIMRRKAPYQVTGISPKTMRQVPMKQIQNTLILPKIISKDFLLVVRFKTPQ